MDKRALDFWDKRNLQVHKLVLLGKKYNLAEHIIKNAAEIVFFEIQDRKRKDHIQIAFDVITVAKNIVSTKYQDDMVLISDTRKVLEGLKSELAIINKEKEAALIQIESLRNRNVGLVSNYEHRLEKLKEEKESEKAEKESETWRANWLRNEVETITDKFAITKEKLHIRNQQMITLAIGFTCFMAILLWGFMG